MNNFVLRDLKAEKQYSFSLEQSLRRAQEKPLFYVSVNCFVDLMASLHYQTRVPIPVRIVVPKIGTVAIGDLNLDMDMNLLNAFPAI